MKVDMSRDPRYAKVRRKANRYLRKQFTSEYLNLELDSDQPELNMRERLLSVYLDGVKAGMELGVKK